jgi:hypothetical protein
VCKKEDGNGIIHHSQKFAQARQRSLEVSFFKKKEKNGGYFNDMPETFCQREINRE